MTKLWAVLPLLSFAVAARAERPPISSLDALAWEVIESPSLSPNGQWAAYRQGPRMGGGDSRMIIRSTTGNTEYRIDIGETGWYTPAFSADNRWVAIGTFPPHRDCVGMSGVDRMQFVGIVWVRLSDGAAERRSLVRSYTLSEGRQPVLAMRPVVGLEAASRSPDLIVRNLATGRERTLQGVAEYAFSGTGRWLAWTINSGSDSGLHLLDTETDQESTVDSDGIRYSKLRWSHDREALTVLKRVRMEGQDSEAVAIVGLADPQDMAGSWLQYRPWQDPGFPRELVVNEDSFSQWRHDGDGFIFNVKRRAATAAALPGSLSKAVPQLLIWNSRDPVLPANQGEWASANSGHGFLATWKHGANKFLQLNDETASRVDLTGARRWVIARDTRAYDLNMSVTGRDLADIYLIDVDTAERRLVGQGIRWASKLSPDGAKIAFVRRNRLYLYDANKDTASDVTVGATAFITDDMDFAAGEQLWGTLGYFGIWSTDSENFLLQDGFDIWRFKAGAAAVNITVDGRSQGKKYELADLSASYTPFGAVDLTHPIYFRTTAHQRQITGFSRLNPSDDRPQQLVWEESDFAMVQRSVSGTRWMIRAKEAPVFLYSRMKLDQYPDLYVANERLTHERRISNGQRQVEQFAWTPGRKIVQYRSDGSAGESGKLSQGVLMLPANYQPGRKYPTIVLVYEDMIQLANWFSHPSLEAYYPGFPGFSASTYASNGYAVLMPDIEHVPDDPGRAAVWSVLPALRAAIDTGIVDEGRVGLYGFSFGGYRSTFLATQTNVFKAIAAGGSVTDHLLTLGMNRAGMSLQGPTAFYFSNQGRMSERMFDNGSEIAMRNSPVANAANITSPLLLMAGSLDDNTHPQHSIELFHILRALHRPVALLEYRNESHGFFDPANQLDYDVRLREYFAFFLKDAPAPRWWSEASTVRDRDQDLMRSERYLLPEVRAAVAP